jgi:histidinol dehydrogenase
MVWVANRETAVELINEYGPEHYILCVANEAYYLENTANAGSVFIGNYTPESAGDYASGTNHTLPTNGYSRQYSGVNLDSFTKSITFQKISEKGIIDLGETIEIMAEAEGLHGHKKAVSLRREFLKQSVKSGI